MTHSPNKSMARALSASPQTMIRNLHPRPPSIQVMMKIITLKPHQKLQQSETTPHLTSNPSRIVPQAEKAYSLKRKNRLRIVQLRKKIWLRRLRKKKIKTLKISQIEWRIYATSLPSQTQISANSKDSRSHLAFRSPAQETLLRGHTSARANLLIQSCQKPSIRILQRAQRQMNPNLCLAANLTSLLASTQEATLSPNFQMTRGRRTQISTRCSLWTN